jgi:hypothetical protein
MPDFSKPRKLKKLFSDRRDSDSTDTSIKTTPPSRNGPGQLFRGAFRALLQPVRVRPAQDAGMEAVSDASSYDPDVYRVTEADSEAYHSYLGSLKRSSSTSGDDSLPDNWATSVSGLYELDATNGMGVLDMTGNTAELSVVEGRIEMGEGDGSCEYETTGSKLRSTTEANFWGAYAPPGA